MDFSRPLRAASFRGDALTLNEAIKAAQPPQLKQFDAFCHDVACLPIGLIDKSVREPLLFSPVRGQPARCQAGPGMSELTLAHYERIRRLERLMFPANRQLRAGVFHQSCVIGAGRELLDTSIRCKGLHLEKRLLYSS